MLTKRHQRFALMARCEWNPALADEFPTQRANDAENVSVS